MSEIVLAEPRGVCAGVARAIDIVEHALHRFGRPIYVRHEIVHNTYVVNDLKAKGAIFIEELAEVPPGATLIFSAHGVSRAVQDEAERRGFRIYDATCPLVTKVHVELAKLHREGYEFIMIGHKGHPEVEGTMGQLDSGIHLVEDIEDVQRIQPLQTGRLAVVTQTTLSVDDTAHILAAIKARVADDRFEGLDEDGQTKFFHELVRGLFDPNKVPEQDLRRYDLNIVAHWQAITVQRNKVEGHVLQMKYFQYLSLLFSELYLDWYFNKRQALLDDLNEAMASYRSEEGALALQDFVADAEKAYLASVLARFGGRVGAAAQALGISRKTLWEKSKRYGLGASE